MQSDFATNLKQAVSEAHVPAVPLAAIRSAANTRMSRQASRRGHAAFYVFVFAILSGITAALGAQLWQKVQITAARHDITNVAAQNLRLFWKPDAMQLRSALSRASYRVIVPSGLPPKARIVNLGTMGTDAFFFDFSWPQGAGKKQSGIAMIVGDPQMLDVKPNAPDSSWTVHGEEVFLVGRLSAAQVASIRYAMEVHPCTLRSVSTQEARRSGRVLNGCSYEFGPVRSMHASPREPHAPPLHHAP